MVRYLIIISPWTGLAVQLAGNGVCDVRELLLLLLEVFGDGGSSVLLEPFGGFFDCIEKLVL